MSDTPNGTSDQTTGSGVLESIRGMLPFDEQSTVGGDSDSDTRPTDNSGLDGNGIVDDVSETHKQYIAPDSIREESKHIETDYQYVRTFYVDALPQHLQKFLLEQIITLPGVDFDISLHMDPKNTVKSEELLRNKKVSLEEKNYKEQNSGRSSFESRDIQRKLERVTKYHDAVSQEGKLLYDVGCYLTVRVPANTEAPEENLDTVATDVIKTIEREVGISTQLATHRQQQTMQSVSPIANDQMDKKQVILGDQAATLFSFISDRVFEAGGVKFGKVTGSESPVILDPFARPNGSNQLRLGMIGSGKSFFVKQNILRLAQSDPEVDVIVVDPMKGFIGVNEALGGGNWITIGGSDTINPLEIEKTPEHILDATASDPWKTKLNDVRWFFDQFADLRGMELSNGEWSVLMRAVKNAYKANGITKDPKTHGNDSPVMSDVIAEVENIIEAPGEHTPAQTDQSKDDRKELASQVEIFLEVFREDGEYANMNGETNLEFTDSRMTYLDISDVSARGGSDSIMMQVLFSMIYQRVKQSDRKTVLAIDEAHKLFGSETSMEFLEEVTRHSRHYDLSIMYISQTVEEFFTNESAKAIADQCSIKCIHRLPNLGYEAGRELLNLNRKEVDFVKDAVPGESEHNYSQALMKVDDMDAGIPLTIRATRDEMAVIDYEPGKTWDELTHPESERIRRALDQKLMIRKGNDIGDDSLAEAVKKAYGDDDGDTDADDTGDTTDTDAEVEELVEEMERGASASDLDEPGEETHE